MTRSSAGANIEDVGLRCVHAIVLAACAGAAVAGGATSLGACGETLPAAPAPSDASTDASTDPPDSVDATPDACVADAASDPKNCGRCGHDCLGGLCVSGKCAAVPLVDWSQTDERCRPDGSTDTDCYAGTIAGVAVDDTWVYFADSGGQGGQGIGGILRVRKDVLAPSKAEGVTKSGSVRTFAMDGAFVYWTHGNAFLRAPADGGPAFDLSTTESASDFLGPPGLVGGEAYFGNQAGVRRIALDPDAAADGGSEPAFADAEASGSIAVLAATREGDRIVWATTSDPSVYTGTIGAYELDGGAVKLAATSQRGRAIAVEGSVVYWVNLNGEVYRADVSTAPIVPTLLGNTDVNPQTLVIAGDDLYVSTWGAKVNTADGIVGSVFRLRKQTAGTAEAAEIVFRGPVLATGLAVDERAIYVGTWFASNVLRIAR